MKEKRKKNQEEKPGSSEYSGVLGGYLDAILGFCVVWEIGDNSYEYYILYDG